MGIPPSPATQELLSQGLNVVGRVTKTSKFKFYDWNVKHDSGFTKIRDSEFKKLSRAATFFREGHYTTEDIKKIQDTAKEAKTKVKEVEKVAKQSKTLWDNFLSKIKGSNQAAKASSAGGSIAALLLMGGIAAVQILIQLLQKQVNDFSINSIDKLVPELGKISDRIAANAARNQTLEKQFLSLKSSTDKIYAEAAGAAKNATSAKEKANEALYETRAGRTKLEAEIADAKKKSNDAFYETRAGRTKLEAEIAATKKQSNDALYETRQGRAKLEDKIASIQNQINKFSQGVSSNFLSQINITIGNIEKRLNTSETKIASLEKVKPTLQDKVIETIQGNVKKISTDLSVAVTRLSQLEKLPKEIVGFIRWGGLMADLPDNFDPFEHLQQTYKTEFNRRVDRYFGDVQGNGDLSGSRPSLKLACRIDDNDNDAMMNIRHNLFFNVIGYSRKNLAVVYGSKFDTAPPVAGHPQLFLYFSQDGAAQPTEEPLIEHEKSCRLMKFSCSSGNSKPAITKADMTEIANEIKTLFLDAKKGITYTTGNKSASYTDPDNGFPKGNYLLVNSKADAENIYSKMCNAIDVPFKGDSHIVVNDPDKPSTTTATAGKTTILSKPRNNRRYRPVAVLRFRYAYISLGNLIPPIFLIDTTLRNQSLVNWL